MQRRDFLKLSATVGAVSCLSARAVAGSNTPEAAQVLAPEKLNWSSCLVNCGSNCPLKVYSRDGIVTRLETDWAESDEYGNHQVRACLRGRSLRQRNYAPDRIKSPLKRKAGTERGDNQWEEISWEQAFKEIGEKVKQLKTDFGPTSIYHHYVSGAYYGFASGNAIRRALVNAGPADKKGFLNYYSNYSWAALNVASPATFGTGGTAGTRLSNVRDSDFFLGLGFNPFETRMSGSGEQYDFLQAIQDRRASGKPFSLVLVDPRYTDSMLGKEDKWLPVRPGTDAAFAAAVAHEMIASGWVEQHSRAFLNAHTVGYDAASILAAIDAKPELLPAGTSAEQLAANNYHDYILGLGMFQTEGAKTPEWAQKICGIPAADIRDVAQRLMNAKAPYISIGAAPNRQANGEQNMRSMYMLSILAGKLGQPGTNTGELPANFALSIGSLGFPNPVTAQICFFDWLEAVERGDKMSYRSHAVKGLGDVDATLPSKIKAVFCSAGNAILNQHSDANYTRDVLKRVGDTPEGHGPELIVVTDCWMTSSAMMADYVLPDSTWLESNDVANDSYASGETGYITFMSSSLKPFFNATKNMYEIGLGIVEASGGDVAAYTEGHKDSQAWLDHLYQTTLKNNPTLGLPATYTQAQQQGFFRRFAPDGGVIAMDGLVNKGLPIKTPTGKIEIFSFAWALDATKRDTFVSPERGMSMAVDKIDPTPKYVATWEGYESDGSQAGDAENAEYPLQVVGYHTKGRVHSSYHNVKWLRDAVEDCAWIHPMDAEKYGVKDGSTIHVHSKRGTTEIRARITPRVVPGVVAMAQGAWYAATNGAAIDKGGCTNALTKYHPCPVGRGNTQHTIRVRITAA